jgi:hypothetical protein
MGHHYVPQFYLRGFGSNGRIWAHDRERQTSFQSSVKGVANENGMYSEEIESFLANRIEAPAISALTKVRRQEKISADERTALARYIVFLWKRVPDGRERALQTIPTVADEIHDEISAELDAAALANPDFSDRAASLKARVAAAIEAHKSSPAPELWYSSFVSEPGVRLVEALLSMNWVFMSSSKLQFLTSDNPVFFFKSEGIGNPKSELSLPLSSTVALWATRSAVQSGEFMSVAPVAVREVNRRTAHNCTRFVYSGANEPWILPFVTKGSWQLTRLVP